MHLHDIVHITIECSLTSFFDFFYSPTVSATSSTVVTASVSATSQSTSILVATESTPTSSVVGAKVTLCNVYGTDVTKNWSIQTYMDVILSEMR